MKTKLIGACALTLATTASMGGVASAKTVHATAPFEKGNASCGLNEPTDTVIGSAKFKRSGEMVTLSVKLTKGAANTAYSVDAVENHCGNAFGLNIFQFTTNKKGKGKGTGTFTMPATATEVFANVYPTELFEYNETPSVTLP